MMLPGSGTLRRAARWIRPSNPLILMYHRVSDTGPDPWGLGVSPRHFTEHLQVLQRHARPVALRQLSQRTRKYGPRTVVVTFDDGYADNVLAALPLLRGHDIPATVFVATALLGKTRAHWWDELADLLLRPGRLPDTLELTVRGQDFRWSIGASLKYAESAYASHRRWGAGMQEPPTERQAVYLSLWELMLALPDDEQQRILDNLADWSGIPQPRVATHRMLSEGELMSLGNDNLIEIGAHSVTHSVLPSLPFDAQHREVSESKRALEALIGKPVSSFSYPYGRTSEPTLSVVRDAGFGRACSTRSASVAPNGDPFDLPRIAVRDCNGEQFARMLNGVFQ
jgi:peptidoglycan/xylan/chitin deacetylase (PgdA/CDA1 family)